MSPCTAAHAVLWLFLVFEVLLDCELNMLRRAALFAVIVSAAGGLAFLW